MFRKVEVKHQAFGSWSNFGQMKAAINLIWVVFCVFAFPPEDWWHGVLNLEAGIGRRDRLLVLNLRKSSVVLLQISVFYDQF